MSKHNMLAAAVEGTSANVKCNLRLRRLAHGGIYKQQFKDHVWGSKEVLRSKPSKCKDTRLVYF